MKEFKDTKNRPMSCAGCELNYHWNELISPIRELLVVKAPKKFCDFVTGIVKKIL